MLIESGPVGTFRFSPKTAKSSIPSEPVPFYHGRAVARPFGRAFRRCTPVIAFLPKAEMLQATLSAKPL